MDNLDLPVIAANQDQKEQTSNDADAQISGALGDTLSCDLSAGDYTLLLADFQSYMGFETTGNTVSRSFVLPQKKRALFFVRNGGTAVLTVTLGTTSYSVAPGAEAFYGQDGTANGLINRTGAGSIAVGMVFSGQPKNAQKAPVPFNSAITLPIGLAGSNFYVGTNPASAATFLLTRISGGTPTSIGSVAISTGGAFTVTFASAVAFAVGDVLEVTAPSPQDSALSDVGLNFFALLN